MKRWYCRYSASLVKPLSAPSAADRRPPWQNSQRLRQAAYAAGALLLLYAVLVVIALLGGPRIGASFLPLPGGGPDPANPVAGLEPSQIPTSGPTIPRGSETPVPTVPPTPGQTVTLPPATTTTAPVAAQTTDGQTTPCPTTKPVPQVVDQEEQTVPPATKVPPKPTTTTVPDPTTQPTKPPATTKPPPTTPTNPPPPPPDEPEDPEQPGLVGGLLDTILGTIGLSSPARPTGVALHRHPPLVVAHRRGSSNRRVTYPLWASPPDAAAMPIGFDLRRTPSCRFRRSDRRLVSG